MRVRGILLLLAKLTVGVVALVGALGWALARLEPGAATASGLAGSSPVLAPAKGAAEPRPTTVAPALALHVEAVGPDDQGLVRGRVVNATGRPVTGARIQARVLNQAGDPLPDTSVWTFGDLDYYSLAPGESYPFLAFSKGKPGDRVEAAATAQPFTSAPWILQFAPKPAGGRPILGELRNHGRAIKSYELQALRVYLVPLNAQGFPIPGERARGWELSMGTDVERLNILEDLPGGQALVVKYNSVRPEDWEITRGIIDSGQYKVAVTSWRPAPDFEPSPAGQLLNEAELRYILGLKPGDGQLERMAYRHFLDKYRPGSYSHTIGDGTVLYVVTTQNAALHPRAGQYFNRHRYLVDATTGFVYGAENWWDASAGPQPQGPGRRGPPGQ